jgi:hypothetical protein
VPCCVFPQFNFQPHEETAFLWVRLLEEIELLL